MSSALVAVALVIGAAVLGVMAVMGLTAVGERRRGHGMVLVVAAGLFFPVTWAAWYLRDEHPYHTAHRT